MNAVRPKFSVYDPSVDGFTVRALSLIVVVIGMLAAAGAPKLRLKSEESRFSAAQQQLLSFRFALDLYKLEMGTYPTTQQGLLALLVNADPAAEPKKWKGPYLESLSKEIPTDPWNEAFQYAFPGLQNPSEFDLYSPGLQRGAASEANLLQGRWPPSWQTFLSLTLLAVEIGATVYLSLSKRRLRGQDWWICCSTCLGSALGFALAGLSYGSCGDMIGGFPFVARDNIFSVLDFLVGLGVPFMVLAPFVVLKGKAPGIS